MWPGASALHYAATAGSVSVVRLLLAAGAAPAGQGGQPGTDPVPCCVTYTEPTAAAVGGFVDSGVTPLHKASGHGHAAVVEALLESAPHLVQATTALGLSPLHWAAVEGGIGDSPQHAEARLSCSPSLLAPGGPAQGHAAVDATSSPARRQGCSASRWRHCCFKRGPTRGRGCETG